MPRGVILVDWTDQGRRTIKDSPDRAEATKAEAAKLAWQKGVRNLFPGFVAALARRQQRGTIRD